MIRALWGCEIAPARKPRASGDDPAPKTPKITKAG